MKRRLLWVGGGSLGTGLILFGVVYSLSELDLLTNPVIYLRGRLSAILLWGGFGLLGLFFFHFVMITRRNRESAAQWQSLKENQQIERRRFLQRLDHELKNPLTAIQAGITNICSEPLGDYVSREAEAVQSQVMRIGQLVADLRKIASLEEMTLDMTGVNVVELLEEVVDVIKNRNNLESRKLLLITPNAPWPIPEIKGDPDLLLLAVHNLIENALKFTDPGDTVEVRAHEEGQAVAIEIADTGTGIPIGEQDRVWEELYRGKKSHGVPGSGLGLPLVKAIVEKHSGEVSLRSKPDQGSVFSIHLPIS